jgi:hypothetical protein
VIAIWVDHGAPRQLTGNLGRLDTDVRGNGSCHYGKRDRPVIEKVFGFDEVQAAYKYMASGAHLGKIVIRLAA